MSAPTVPASTTATTPCPRCQAPASGKFCANCGAPLEGARCAGCASYLTPGARFCHRCGLAAGADASPSAATPARGRGAGVDAVPWAVAAIALLAVVALVAGQNFRGSRGGALDGSSNALPVPGLDDRGTSAGGSMGPAGGGDAARARTDISQMSPEERAARLHNRIMQLYTEGKRDSVVFFAPMAITAFQMLDTMSLDQRYDLGRIGEISGLPDLAKAQADTILRESPTHLLGLILAANVAGMRGDPTAQKQYQQRFMAARSSELAKGLPEYEAHAGEIAAATTAIGGDR